MKKILAIIFLLGLTAEAFASYISLNTSLTAKATDKELRAIVTSVNKGDEAAYSVQAVVQAGGRTVSGEKKSELPVNGRYEAMFNLPVEEKLPGVYPLVLTMHYADANQYPFSALTVQTYTYKNEPPPSEVFGRSSVGTFWKNGRIKLLIKNMSDQELSIKITLVTPRELIPAEKERSILIAPRAERRLELGLENFSALSGSTYQLFAILEYEMNGLHQTTVVPGLAKIVESHLILGLDYTYLVIILVGLVIAAVLFQIFKK